MRDINMKLSFKNIKINNYLVPLIFSLLFIVTESATAVTVNTIASNVSGSIAGIVKLMVLVSYLAGVGFAMGGILQFKAHKDNPTQVPISKPVVLLCLAGFLLFLPSVMQTAGQTLFGASTELRGSSTLVDISTIQAS